MSQVICKTHNAGPYNEDSNIKLEHETNSDSCIWEAYDINKECTAIRDAKIQVPNSEADYNISQKLYEFANNKIKKKVIAQGDSNSVYVLMENNGHLESICLSNGKAKDWLRYSYYRETGKNHSDDSYRNTFSLMKSEVLMNSPNIETIYNRIAMVEGAIYYDLVNSDWQAIKITKTSVETVSLDENTPIFVRKQHQKAQVIPKFGRESALDDLVQLLRIPYKDRQIFKVHLISMFIEKYPMPIMNILGEQGSNKTTLARSVKNIVDPSGENTSSLPRNTQDLILHLNNRYLVNFDNVSGFDSNTSDIFCRAITGDGQSRRQLYTDQDEVIFNYRRKIIINGIAPSLEFPDYRERSIFYEMLPLKEHERLTEEEYNKKFDYILPYVLGNIFTTLQKALQLYDKVRGELKNLERMADFTIFGECISRALGYQPLSFRDSYSERVQFSSVDARESYPILQLIDNLMADESKEKYEDTVTKFYKRIKGIAEKEEVDIDSRGVSFPRLPNKTKQHLQKLKPILRNIGFEVEVNPYNKRDGVHPRGSHIITITRAQSPTLSLESDQKTPLSSLSSQNHEQNLIETDRHGEVPCIPACMSKDNQSTHVERLTDMTDVNCQNTTV